MTNLKTNQRTTHSLTPELSKLQADLSIAVFNEPENVEQMLGDLAAIIGRTINQHAITKPEKARPILHQMIFEMERQLMGSEENVR